MGKLPVPDRDVSNGGLAGIHVVVTVVQLNKEGKQLDVMTGITLFLYTTKAELDNAKKGVSTIVAWVNGQQPEGAIYSIGVSVDICDVLDNEVRVNVFKSQEQITEATKKMGAAFGGEIAKALEGIIA